MMTDVFAPPPQAAEPPGKEATAALPNRNQIIARISGQLGAEHFPTGERAALKRMDPDQLSPGAYAAAVRLLLKAGGDAEVRSDTRLKRWVLLIHGMALMSGPGQVPHGWADGNAAGRVMFDSGYSEDRLRRLLEARRTTFDDLLSRMARFLAAKRAVINWGDLAPLILDPEESGAAEQARLNLMRQFITREARYEREAGENGRAGA